MKKKILGVCLLASLMLGAIACPSKSNSPSGPANPTNTPTMSGPTNTPTLTSTPTATVVPGCNFLLNDCSNLTVNGNWAATSNTTLSLSGSHGTASSSSVDVNITTGASYFTMATLNSFTPALSGAMQIVLDLYVDSSVIPTGTGGYCTLALQADTSGSTNQYQVNANTTNPNIVAGAQSVTVTLAYGASNLTAANTITKLYFNLSESAATTGNIYIGAVRVIYSSPTCPTVPTPVAADSWTFENQSLTNSLGSWVSQGTICTGIGIAAQGQDSSYSMGVTGTWTAAYDSLTAAIFPGTAINGSTFNGVEAWVYLPTTTLPGGYPGAFLQLGDGTNFPETPWISLSRGWTYLNFPVSSWGASLNKSAITMVQVIVQSDGTTPTGSGYVLVDNVDFY